MLVTRGITRAARPLCRPAASALGRPLSTKTSTGIVGLAVDPSARANLLKANQEVLDLVKEVRATRARVRDPPHSRRPRP